ncbi:MULTISPECIES: ABC transporter ATP-binding protein [unclassified Nonomuraea]|uniref:ABC transporter ATP-binding protein n=1 Tax=unclassified Nonomuraea TaxID=2593643 RepID=UPI0033C668DA
MSAYPLLEAERLHVTVRKDGAALTVLDDVSFAVGAGRCLGVVGESGCGKSLTLRAVMGLLPPGAERTGGEVRLSPRDGAAPVPVPAGGAAGAGLAMVFQDSHASLDPTMRVGTFLTGVIRRTGPARSAITRAAARRRAVELLEAVGVPDPELRFRAYPHELSGGMRQRVAIALALATEPRVLLCDEPTTALDVTLQAEILRLLDAARAERGLGLVFVSHDIGVVRQVADVVAVMYAGQVIEAGPVEEVLARPRHPYTRALLEAAPALGGPRGRFRPIPGTPPSPADYPAGCRFGPRCARHDTACSVTVGGLDARLPGHRSSCVHDPAGPADGAPRGGAADVEVR